MNFTQIFMDLRKKIPNRLEIFKESQDMIIDHAFNKMNFRSRDNNPIHYVVADYFKTRAN